MYPILLQLGSTTIYSLWLFLAFGILSSLVIVHKLTKYKLVKLSFLADNSLLIFFSSLILSRLIYVIYNWHYYYELIINQKQFFEIFFIWDKGLSAWGGILGIFITLFILSRKEKENFFDWSDILIISIFFGMVFADIGAFLDGRNYGIPTNLPWGMLVESSQYAIPIHPVQIYAAIYSLLIGIILFIVYNNPVFKKSGGITYLGIVCYSFFRFIEEFIRGDESILFFGVIREAQVYSFLALLISSYLLYKYFVNNNN